MDREQVVEKFSTLGDYHLMKELEQKIYEQCMKQAKYTDNFPVLYFNKCLMIYRNLKNKKNDLLERFVRKKISSDFLATSNEVELFPKRWEEQMKNQERKEDLLYAMKREKNCDTWCGKCKKQNVYYTEQQASSDEPSIISYECLECGVRWARR